MTMAKFLRFLLLVLVGGIIYLFFVREEMPFAQLTNNSRNGSDFVSRDNDTRRGDDPTYSQEVRQNAAIVLETQRKQMELEQQLANEREQAARSQQELVQKLGDVTRELSQLRETQGKVDEDHGAAVQQEVDARMEKINETLATLQQQQAENQAASQARISELEQQLAAAQAANTA